MLRCPRLIIARTCVVGLLCGAALLCPSFGAAPPDSNGSFIASSIDGECQKPVAADAALMSMAAAPCPADVDGDLDVDVSDFLVVLCCWGPCPCLNCINPPCVGDISPQPAGNGVVDIDDILMVIAAWGPCP